MEIAGQDSDARKAAPDCGKYRQAAEAFAEA